ncbi:hypothetical protein [Cytobacillus oceanisediminis]|uniref:Uncharacterized protein n=1 Tax=Cytobacillus oceanisediminis TaxID=665099 RepID=A0ABX3CLK8_9BACI|nr:hypothetical protein [Cytobacillus oceanisediminis]OHX41684.1 hypothetical protein BBV17_27995 [Cytobacillus oceanisediminis]
MEEPKVIFNEDQKAVLLKALKDIHFANGQLHEWVKKDSLTEEMSKTLPSLIENYFSEVAKVLNYESHLLAEKEKRYEDIRKANIRIRELEEKLGSGKPVEGLKEQLQHLADKVRDWWDKEGFHHVSEMKYHSSGVMSMDFCFMLDHYSSFSKTPETDKRNKKEHIQMLRDQGFEFADFEKGRSEKLNLIDNPINRTLLSKMLKTRFPSLEIHSWDNMSSYSDPDVFVIWHVNAYIYDLKDI